MAYFFILPAFIVWLIIGMVSLAALRTRPIYPYAWRILLWSSVGFVIANVLFMIAVAGAAVLVGPGPAEAERTAGRDALQLFFGLSAVVGPILASLAGWAVGTGAGILLARRSRHQATTAM